MHNSRIRSRTCLAFVVGFVWTGQMAWSQRTVSHPEDRVWCWGRSCLGQTPFVAAAKPWRPALHGIFTVPVAKAPFVRLMASPPKPIRAACGRAVPEWDAEQLPFFCKIEHQWGKKMTIPVKFRLGSVEYVDWLEGKHDQWQTAY
jgi:hypothetical protein